jgi:hypothetical protein
LEKGRQLELALAAGKYDMHRLYTNGMNSLWLAGNDELAQCHELLHHIGLGGVVLRYAPAQASKAPTQDLLPTIAPDASGLPHFPYIGRSPETIFHQRIRNTLDPKARFRD